MIKLCHRGCGGGRVETTFYKIRSSFTRKTAPEGYYEMGGFEVKVASFSHLMGAVVGASNRELSASALERLIGEAFFFRAGGPRAINADVSWLLLLS